MSKGLEEDLELSASVLYYLYATYNGKYAYFNILSALRSPMYSSGEFVMTRGNLETLSGWLGEMDQNKALLNSSWREPEGPDPRRAWEMMETIKVEVSDCADRSESIMRRADISSDLERVALLIAYYGRYAYTRHTYLVHHLQFAQRLRRQQLIDLYQSILPSAQRDLQLAEGIVEIFAREERPAPEFFASLKEEALGLPGVFRATAHDLTQLLKSFEPEFTFEHADISEREAAGWKDLRMLPDEAGYWTAHSFSPASAHEWIQVGLTDPIVASGFRNFGFTPGQAVLWFNVGFLPLVAHRWRSAGYSSEAAAEAAAQGTPIPGPIIKKAEDVL